MALLTAVLTFPGHQGLSGEEGPCFHLEALLEQHFTLNEGNTDPVFIVIPDIESHGDF